MDEEREFLHGDFIPAQPDVRIRGSRNLRPEVSARMRQGYSGHVVAACIRTPASRSGKAASQCQRHAWQRPFCFRIHKIEQLGTNRLHSQSCCSSNKDEGFWGDRWCPGLTMNWHGLTKNRTLRLTPMLPFQVTAHGTIIKSLGKLKGVTRHCWVHRAPAQLTLTENPLNRLSIFSEGNGLAHCHRTWALKPRQDMQTYLKIPALAG